MLYIVAVAVSLILLAQLGLVTAYSIGGLIHILLGGAVAVSLLRLIRSRDV